MIGVRQRSLGRLACQESLSYRCATRFLLALEKSCGGRLHASRAAWRFMGIGFGVGMGYTQKGFDEFSRVQEQPKMRGIGIVLLLRPR